MRSKNLAMPFFICLAILMVATSEASTFRRASLEALAESSDTIVVAEAIGSKSYWNADRSLILTDVDLRISEVVKGENRNRQVTATLPGGSVDGLTTVIVGGAALEPGRSYVVFLSSADLPGAARVLTVKNHAQGVFEIGKDAGGGLRARSQATRVERLVAGPDGETRPAGGAEGFELENMIDQLRHIADRHEEKR